MSLNIERLWINDVILVRPRRFDDDRGYFVETFSAQKYAAAGIDAGFVQDNQSLSKERGIIRGLHFQAAPEPQAKLVRVIAGSVFDVAVDMRKGSATFGKWCGATLTGEGCEQLFVPVGFAHAFCVLEPDTLVAYKVDGFYNKAAEGGLRWDDPDIGIEWPVPHGEIKVSEKDAELPFLRDAAVPSF